MSINMKWSTIVTMYSSGF